MNRVVFFDHPKQLGHAILLMANLDAQQGGLLLDQGDHRATLNLIGRLGLNLKFKKKFGVVSEKTRPLHEKGLHLVIGHSSISPENTVTAGPVSNTVFFSSSAFPVRQSIRRSPPRVTT